MYARVATFEGRDPARVRELIEAIRERSSVDALETARRVLVLAERGGGIDLGVAILGSSEAMRAAEPAFERMGDDIPEALRGRRMSVHVYEVAIDDVAEGAAAARVTRFEGSPDRVDDGVLFINEHIVPGARELTGWRGLIAEPGARARSRSGTARSRSRRPQSAPRRWDARSPTPSATPSPASPSTTSRSMPHLSRPESPARADAR